MSDLYHVCTLWGPPLTKPRATAHASFRRDTPEEHLGLQYADKSSPANILTDNGECLPDSGRVLSLRGGEAGGREERLKLLEPADNYLRRGDECEPVSVFIICPSCPSRATFPDLRNIASEPPALQTSYRQLTKEKNKN